MSSDDAIGQNYETVSEQFKDSGFINIKEEIVYDLITGWINKPGEVDSVAIDGNDEFPSEYLVRPDKEVVIKYHAFKKERPQNENN